MKKTLTLVCILLLSSASYGQIIADHTVVDKINEIPQYYIDQVKKMFLSVPGQSHSEGYYTGLLLLQEADPKFAVNVTRSGTPESYTSSHLRAAGTMWGDKEHSTGWQYGIDTWDWAGGEPMLYTYDPVQAARVMSGLSYAYSNNLTISAIGYGFCYNEYYWESYITATQAFVDYCAEQGLPTKVFFTTGPVDSHLSLADEESYNSSLRWVAIRNHVAQDATRILFDYADILSYNDAGQVQTRTWNGHTYTVIHPDNITGDVGTWSSGHIGGNGCLRLGKAMWWMLARLAGWDGGQGSVAVESITVTGAGGVTTISRDNGQLQLNATVQPSNATNKTVTWSVVNGTGQATINSTGLVTAVANGTVTARATANDGSGIVGSLVITITGQVIPVTGITVTGAGGSTTITQDNGQLQLTATVVPSNATNKTVTWSLVNGTGQATINSTGLVTAVSNGTVTVRATANDGSGIVGSLVITITGQVIPVTGITVTGAGGSSVINSDGGQLQLIATVVPSNATNKAVTWSITNGTGQATISTSGVVTAVANGTVTARATANDGSGIVGSLVITITGQVIPVTGIMVTGAGGASTITQDNGQLQLTAAVQPSDATNKTVTWSLVNGTGQATINSTGLVTAVSNGTVTARATANDGSGIVGSLVITITGQVIPVTGITVTGAGGASTITQDNGQLQLTAAVQPSDAMNKTVTWSIVNGTGQATINTTGLVTAVSNGTVTARATANDGSGIVGSLVITITGQVIPVTGITVTGAGGSSVITSDGGQLQLTATVAPANATNKAVTWSITNGTGQATINTTGLVTAVSAGTVTAVATANDGSGVQGSLVITISNQIIPVTSITVTGAGGATTITQDNGQLQLTATVQPSDATNKTVTWSVVNSTGQATINSTGLVTAVANGTVTARATANDGSGIVGSLVITITGQVIPVTGITVTGAGGASTITQDNGQLQLTATVQPSDATNKTVTWSVVNGTGQATINSTGLVTAVANGTVTARATANDGSGIVGSLVITITGQVIPVTGITVTGAGGSTTITQDNGQLQLTATVQPSDATNKTVTWSIVNGTGQATINTTGLVTAVSNGTVTARATANDGSGIVGSLVITISGQVIPVTGITVTGAGGSSVITSDGGQLQLTATVTPANATNKTVTWSIVNSTGQATINTTGLVTAVSGGTVTAVAVANDGSGVQGTMAITITYQFIPVTGITITGAGGATTIAQDKGTLALTATIVPSNATNKSVTWSLLNGTGQATISASGVVTAVANGTVTARSTANDGTGIFGELVISISGQTIQVTKITVAAAKGEPVILTNKGTLQLSFIILPENATNKTVTWSIGGGTGQASVNSNGLVTAIADGTVVVRAMATDGSGVFGEITVSIINQIVLVTGITVTGEGSITTISIDDGTLRMLAAVNPSNASNKSVTWSIVSGNGHAGLSEEGILTARTNGKVVVRATSNDGSNIYGQVEITITNQSVSVSSIKVKVKTKSSTTTTVNGELALEAEIFPEDATQKDISWSVVNGTGAAIISESGILKGITPGEVIVVATSLDGSGVVGELAITINLVESIKIRYTRNEIIIQVPEHLLPAKASLHNLYGSHMQSKVIDSTECIFDISELLPGVYVVSVYNSIVQDAAKIIVAY